MLENLRFTYVFHIFAIDGFMGLNLELLSCVTIFWQVELFDRNFFRLRNFIKIMIIEFTFEFSFQNWLFEIQGFFILVLHEFETKIKRKLVIFLRSF